MTLQSLKIDGVEYLSYVLENYVTVDISVEDGLNNPKSSFLECEFYNANNFQDTFLNTDPYGIVAVGLVVVEMLISDPDFPITEQIFTGYLDRENIEVDPHQDIIKMRFVGIEKKYSETMSKYDLSQAFYELSDDDSIGQRGNRSADQRLDPSAYSPIESMVENILEDLGFSSSQRVIDIPNSTSFNYKYNEETYGALTNETITTKRGYNILGERLPNSDSVEISSFIEVNNLSESYSSLIRQFANLVGCVWFYNHKDQKFYFVPRDYDFSAETVVDNSVIEGNASEVYHTPYDGIRLTFKDIIISAKKSISYPSFAETITYGFEHLSSRDTVTQALVNSTYYIKDGSAYLYKVGSTAADTDLFLNNPIEINLEDNLSDYIAGGYDGDSVATFLDKVIENYDYVLDRYITTSIMTNTILVAPINISYNGNSVTVLDSKLDLSNNTTTIEFER